MSSPTPQIDRHSPKSLVTLLAPSSNVNPLADTEISIIKNVASASKKKKKASLSKSKGKPPLSVKNLASPSQIYACCCGLCQFSPIRPEVALATRLVIQGNLCHTQKPIPSLEPSTDNESIRKSVERETHKNEPDPFLTASTSTSLPPLLTPIQASKKKTKASLTEPKGKSRQWVKKTVHKPQVSIASPKSKDPDPLISPVIQGNLCHTQKPNPSLEPSTVYKSIRKQVERETHKNEQVSVASPKNKDAASLIPRVFQGNLCHTQKLIPSPETSTVNKVIHKPFERETHRNEQELFLSPSSSTSLPPSFKPPPLTPIETCSSVSSQNTPKKSNYVWVPKGTTPLYSVPEDFKELIKKDIVPQVLRRCLTPATYKNFFEAMMYSEDYYCEKWSDYLLEDIKLELQEAALYMKPRRGTNMTGNGKNKNINENGMKDKVFVAFRIDSIPERRPFLLSRDYVHLRPSGKGKEVEPFQGVLYRVVQKNLVLAEFGDDFILQHSSSCQYDVSFSFNRVCLKRSYQALSATTNTLLHNFLFPSQTPRANMLDPPYFTPYLHNLDKKQLSAVENILRLSSSPPFLVEGPLFVFVNKKNVMEKSATYFVIQEAVQQIYRSSPGSRILINAPRNIICDMLMTSLMVEIPESEIFRANAAFRDQDEVDGTILPFCPFEGECFTCPPLNELQEFKIVLSTYMSSFRLHHQGINTGHFSHIFLVDASSIMEPEMIVSLSNLADEKTVVVVTGAYGNCPNWVRSNIGREYGLKVSYFERILERQPYCILDPLFVACIRNNEDDLTNAFLKKTREVIY